MRLMASAIRVLGSVLALSVLILVALGYTNTGILKWGPLFAAIAYGALMFYLANLLDRYDGPK